LYAAAFALVVLAGGFLVAGLVRDDVRPIAVALAAGAGALLLLWAGISRSSGPPQTDRHR
jgi:hypothetical protein